MLSPVEFRRRLVIDADGAAVPFKPDAWQEADFQAMDPAWQYAAGVWTGPPPTIRRAWAERPRGHAKTADLAVMATFALLAAARPIRGIAAAGDRDQARLLIDSIATLARCNKFAGDLLDVQTWAVVNKHTGATLDVLSSDVATSYGQLVDFVAADEVTHWPEDKGEKLWTSLLSTVAKRANCLLHVICNAGFTEHFAHRVMEAVQTDPAWHFSHLDGPVASWITPDRLAEQERLLPGPAFERLWLNRWTSGSGDALSAADIQAAITQTEPMTGAEEGWVWYAGLDLSVSRDHCSLVVIGKHHHGRLRLATVRSWAPPRGGKIDLMAVRNAVVELHGRYNFQLFVDPYQAELMVAELQQLGVWAEMVPFVGTALMQMATALIEAFTSRNIELFNHTGLIADLKRLRIKESPSGWKLAAPRTGAGHCDNATALALACLGAQRSPPAYSLPDPQELAEAQEEIGRHRDHNRLQRRFERGHSSRYHRWGPQSSDDPDDEGWTFEGSASGRWR
jgi:phage terminase large subunit-like protein